MRWPIRLYARKSLRQFAEPPTIPNLRGNLPTRHGRMDQEEHRYGDDRRLSEVDIFHPRSEGIEATRAG